MANEPITVGGAYKESDDHVPNPTDMVAQFNTEGVGAHQRIEEVSPVFEVDKVKTAEEILGALDPQNDAVSSDRVLLPDTNVDNDTATDQIKSVAQARVDQGVEIGGPTPAEREASLEGDEGVQAAVDQDASNAAANSTGNRSAGQHDGDDTQISASPSSASDAADDTTDDDQTSDEPSGNASTEEWQEYAKKQGATDEDLDGMSRNDLRDKYGSKS